MKFKVVGVVIGLMALVFIGKLLATPTTITVCASGCTYDNTQLQTALNAAAPGDQVLLEAGHTYTASGTGFVMGAQCHTARAWDCITLRTGVNSVGDILSLSLFPTAGQRLDVATYAVGLAKLIPGTNNEAALRTIYPGETNATCAAAPCVGDGWTVKWVEFGPKPDWNSRALVRFGTNNAGKEFQSGSWVATMPGGDTQDKLNEMPQFLTLYQCYIHGSSYEGQHQGLILASKDARVLHNVFDDIKSMLETQAITGINGIGPYDIENNQISATGENVLFGGGDTYLRLKATITGTPTATSIQMVTPLWEELDGTTAAASFSTDIYSGIYIQITHAGVDYGGIKCTFTTDTCTFPALSFTPSVGDTVRWCWLMGGLTFKQNWVYKNPAWLQDNIPTITNVTATAQAGGSLTAGTYCYRIVTKARVSGVTTASSTGSVEQCATVVDGQKVHVTWDADSHASTYRVYIGPTGAENHYFDVTAPDTTFDDTGAAGTAGTVAARGDFWPVKNNWELKQGDGASPQGAILVEGNIFDRSWCCAQNNIISMKVNNQNTKDVSVTLRNITFRNNWIRHGNRAIALTCTTTGNASPQSPSGPMENVSITNNLFTDLTDQYVGLSGTTGNSAVLVTTGSYANEVISKGCIDVSFTHNTFLAEANNLNGPMWLNINSPADAFVNLVVRDNIMARDCSTAGCTSNGTNSLKGFNPSNKGEGTPGWTNTTTGTSAIDHNVWPDGDGVYTAGPFTNSFFPTDAALKATHLSNYTNCNADTDITGCALVGGSSLHNAASDGTDLGANIATIKSFTDNARSGGITAAPQGPPPNIGGTNDAHAQGHGRTRVKIGIR